MSKLWTIEEDVFIIKNWHKITTKEIADLIGKPRQSVDLRVKKIVTIESRRNKKWTEMEDEILLDLYGSVPLIEIIDKMKRSANSIRGRVKFLVGTERPEVISDSFTTSDIAEIMGIDLSCIHKWENKGGIPFVFIHNSCLVNITAFWEWLKMNTERVRFVNVKDEMLTTYPSWYQDMVKKKKCELHKSNKIKYRSHYTPKEDALLWYLYTNGSSFQEISKESGRTFDSVKHRIRKIQKYKKS